MIVRLPSVNEPPFLQTDTRSTLILDIVKLRKTTVVGFSRERLFT
jgi:hypothetical protein